MARIRTIKPEFQLSQSMGNISRDARLTFIQLWPHCDDGGRIRANSRMLASLLFPYDDDAPGLMDTWLGELEREGCLVRYKVGAAEYIEVTNFLKHQKVDKPRPSNLPGPLEGSRIVANAREASPLDQGPRTKECIKEGNGLDLVGASQAKPPKATGKKSRIRLPEDFPLQRDLDWATEKWLGKGRADLCGQIADEVAKFRDHHSSHATASADWPASWRTWATNAMNFTKRANGNGKHPTAHDKFFAAGEAVIREILGGEAGNGGDSADAAAPRHKLLPS